MIPKIGEDRVGVEIGLTAPEGTLAWSLKHRDTSKLWYTIPLGIFLEKHSSKRKGRHMMRSALQDVHHSKNWEQPSSPVLEEGVDKLQCSRLWDTVQQCEMPLTCTYSQDTVLRMYRESKLSQGMASMLQFSSMHLLRITTLSVVPFLLPYIYNCAVGGPIG